MKVPINQVLAGLSFVIFTRNLSSRIRHQQVRFQTAGTYDIEKYNNIRIKNTEGKLLFNI